MKRLKSFWVLLLVLIPLFIFATSFSDSNITNPQNSVMRVDRVYVGYFNYSVGGGLYIKVKVYVDPSNYSVVISGSDSLSQNFSATGIYSSGNVQNFNGNDGTYSIQYSGTLN